MYRRLSSLRMPLSSGRLESKGRIEQARRRLDRSTVRFLFLNARRQEGGYLCTGVMWLAVCCAQPT
jgi:hypothetical protein